MPFLLDLGFQLGFVAYMAASGDIVELATLFNIIGQDAAP
jgi:hypothetical protein